jgi:hypothetical protein
MDMTTWNAGLEHIFERGSLQFQLCIIQQWYKWTIKEEDTNPTAKSNAPQNILRSSLLHLC